MHRSVPGTHGYAVRSREIVLNQRAKGLEPIVLTSPSQAPLGHLDSEHSETIEGIRYVRTSGRLLPATTDVYDSSKLRSALRIIQNIKLFSKALKVVQKYKPTIIHSHSPFTCGIVGNIVGAIKGIPTIYEMRGIWEDSHSGRYGLDQTSLRYRTVRRLETIALKGANINCTIGKSLKSEIVSRGIKEEKVFVIPNGVDVRNFSPGPPSSQLQKKMGMENKVVVGYIGSFFHYEGLDLLVRAIACLAGEFPQILLLLVGDGEALPILKQIVSENGIEDKIIFAGRIPHNEIADYYRLCDFMVLPRKDTRETRVVPPLKPLEIMAMGKPLIAANIGGHQEIIEDGINGIFFEAENVDDLAAKCAHLIKNEEYRRDLGMKSRNWVEQNRDWTVLVNQYITLYELLVRDPQFHLKK